MITQMHSYEKNPKPLFVCSRNEIFQETIKKQTSVMTNEDVQCIFGNFMPEKKYIILCTIGEMNIT